MRSHPPLWEFSDSVMRRASTGKLVPLQPEAQNDSDGTEPSQRSFRCAE